MEASQQRLLPEAATGTRPFHVAVTGGVDVYRYVAWRDNSPREVSAVIYISCLVTHDDNPENVICVCIASHTVS